MLEDIRLTPEEILDAKIDYFPVTLEDHEIANTATDKAKDKIADDIHDILVSPKTNNYRVAAVEQYIKALKEMVKK